MAHYGGLRFQRGLGRCSDEVEQVWHWLSGSRYAMELSKAEDTCLLQGVEYA